MIKAQRKPLVSFFMIMVMIKPCISFICPSSASITPCTCNGTSGSNTSIRIECLNKNMTDLQMSRILDQFLAPGISPVLTIKAQNNLLSKVPDQIKKMSSLSAVTLDFNQIREIPYEVGKPFFNNSSTKSSLVVSLSNNLITRISPGVFNFSSASRVEINLSVNRINSLLPDTFRFPSATYVSISLWRNLISMVPNGFFNLPLVEDISIYLNDNQITVMPPSNFFNFPFASYIWISLNSNSITSVPCISQLSFPQVKTIRVDLSCNKITTVTSCAFHFPIATDIIIRLANNSIQTISHAAFNFLSANAIYISLDYNKISTIPPDTFSQGHYRTVSLINNNINRLESAVFKSPVMDTSLNMAYQRFDIRGNPIDCLTDPCHLAWLLKYPTRLNRIKADGICSNWDGFPFSTIK